MLLSAALVWDFFTVGAMEATLTRASKSAYDIGTQAVGWTQEKAKEYEINKYLKKALAERNAAVREMLELEEEDIKIAPEQMAAIMKDIASLPETDFGDSVFSREAINSYIKEASTLTGIQANYLAHLAERESAFDPVAAAGTSSAKGLYQFTDSTWLEVFKRHGADHGVGNLAKHIKVDANGRRSVENQRIRRRILNLRLDPKLSTFMAAHYAREQRAFLTKRLGREPDYAELYIAHFLGAGGAAKLFIAYEERPKASAVKLFPAAAKANRRFFYDDKGKSVDIAQLRENLFGLCDNLIAHV